MELIVVGSSSSGNGYILKNEHSVLFIEAGVHFDKFKEHLNHDISNVVGCIVSHSHGDHNKYVHSIASAGIPVYGHKTIFSKKHHNYKTISENQKFKVGEYKIISVALTHDVPCLGFYIRHNDIGTICFITDTKDVPYNFGELNNIMIECNYDRDTIDTNETMYFLRDRVVDNHLSIQGVVEFLHRQDLSVLNNIILLHTSTTNSDINLFREIIIKEFGKTPVIALGGISVGISEQPF
jgi:phosphoribosyl 1,2-cyclic phosphodiesterase